MRRASSGFTLIELLVVIGIIGVLAAVLLPAIVEGQKSANASADALQLRQSHSQWIELYRQSHNKALPMEGGHKFVLSAWTSNTCEHTVENFDKFFTPGLRDGDADYQQKRNLVVKGENPWPNLQNVSPEDTHYAGRARADIKTAMQSANEALMANDNDGQWCLPNGSVNILLWGGAVRSLSYDQIREIGSLGDFDLNAPVATTGPNSPIPECRKLDQ